MTPGTSVSATIRPFTSSDHRRLAAGAAKSSTNPTASILRSRWTPTDASPANLHTGRIAAYGFSGKVGAEQRLQQNAYVERYNRTVRHEWRDLYIFETIEEVQQIATEWLWTYNNERPNMGIGGVTPAMKLKMAA